MICTECNGQRRIEASCSCCSGGYNSCTACSGIGYFDIWDTDLKMKPRHRKHRCVMCHGKGEIRCNVCYGRGYNYKSCPKCNGKGHIQTQAHPSSSKSISRPSGPIKTNIQAEEEDDNEEGTEDDEYGPPACNDCTNGDCEHCTCNGCIAEDCEEVDCPCYNCHGDCSDCNCWQCRDDCSTCS